MKRWVRQLVLILMIGAIEGASPVFALTLTEAQKLLADDSVAGDRFGYSIALFGNTAMIGTGAYSYNLYDTGAVYVFTRQDGGPWRQRDKLLPDDGGAFDRFGRSVALSGDTALIGAAGDDDNGLLSGSVYVYTRQTDGTWRQQSKLMPSDGVQYGEFGRSVALSGDTALIGASGDDENGFQAGAAYIFTRQSDGTWLQQDKLLANDGLDFNYFGISVALSGDTAMIGTSTYRYGYSDSGSVYVFIRQADGAWLQQVKLLADDGEAGDDFGLSVALFGDMALIGANGDDDNGPFSGSAYIFTRDSNGTWSQQQKLLASDGKTSDYFGYDVALSSDKAVIGALGGDDMGLQSGSAYVFIRGIDGAWRQQVKLLADDGEEGGNFGAPVALSGDTTLIGATGDNDNGPLSGSAYVFSLAVTLEQQLDELVAQVESLTENTRGLNGLANPLKTVHKNLAKGNPIPAVNKLEAFIHKVEAKIRSRKLSSEDGNELIDAAIRIIQAIEAEY